MNETNQDRLREIRQRKAKELRDRLESETGDLAGSPQSTPDSPIAIEGPDHLEEVVATYEVVLVDWYADWCGPCRMLEPTIEALAAESDAAIAKVDVDRHPDIARQLGARGVPTIVLYADGDPVERLVGVQSLDSLEDLIEKWSP